LKFAVIGSGGHGKVVCDAALEARLGMPLGFIDDDRSRVGMQVLGVPVLGSLDMLSPSDEVVLVMGIGDNAARRRAYEHAVRHGYTVLSVMHPSAIIGREVQIGNGAVLLARATVNAGTRIGENAILNTACSVDHDCEIGAHSHIAPGATLAGSVVVGEQTVVGAGAVAIPGVRIGASAMVGAGAVVVCHLPDGCNARGVPAKAVPVGRQTGEK
jgi:sugar O-acyltransferase (sialic acid O-acetyltransferase NeuD family)